MKKSIVCHFDFCKEKGCESSMAYPKAIRGKKDRILFDSRSVGISTINSNITR
jgi:hypothetical protein